MNDTEVPDYLLELMSDKNKAISKLCIKTLDIIAVSKNTYINFVPCLVKLTVRTCAVFMWIGGKQ